jgi:SLOG cluster3 family
MATNQLKKVFLSASIPLPERNPKYYKTADVIAIRDAVIAVATTVLPKHKLVWGGHPSITPIMYYVMSRLGLNIQEHLTLYQSRYFEKYFPEDNNKFENVILTENTKEKDSSVFLMRKKMFSENQFVAGVFIGGMEGIEDEFKLFREFHPEALLLPIASTGAATRIVYSEFLPVEMRNERLVEDYAYMSLFQDLLIDKI